MGADTKSLDRERPQAEVAALLEQLGTAVDVDALAVGELEAQAVELPARHRHADRRSVARVLEREEDAGPALVTAQLGDLALDPDSRQPAEPLCDTPVEGSDRVDGAVVVRKRLDLAHARQR